MSALRALATKLLDTGEYSDLTIKTASNDIKVHKAIVCGQSEWFTNAVKESRFMEGQTGVVNLTEHSAGAVYAMIVFLYTGDYMFSHELVRKAVHAANTDNSAPDPFGLLLHIDTYGLADMIQHNQLKRSAESKFEAAIKSISLPSSLADLAKKVYEVSPPGPQGDALRSIVVDAIIKHADKILVGSGPLKTAMDQVASFGADVAVKLNSKRSQELSSLSNLQKFSCANCGWQLIAPKAGKYWCASASCNRSVERRVMAAWNSDLYSNNFDWYVYECTAGHHFFGRSSQQPCTCNQCSSSCKLAV